MREPAFWYRPHAWQSIPLAPFAAIYGAVSGARMHRAGVRADVPVVCVGNYHVGGAGKTPVVLALTRLLSSLGETPAVLSRGYGGALAGPLRVEAAGHSAADVGDEPLMMAQHVPVIVARDRPAGAAFASRNGASAIVMDDGFQNPSLAKDLRIVVIDGARGLGNGRVFPAGPLRAPLAPQLECTDALVVVGNGDAAEEVAAQVRSRGAPVMRAHIVPDKGSLAALRGKRVLAFAGIGDPQRFFDTLRNNDVEVARTVTFADHHPFSADEIGYLTQRATAEGLALVTTEKDLARIRAITPRPAVAALRIAIAFDAPEELQRLVADRLALARRR